MEETETINKILVGGVSLLFVGLVIGFGAYMNGNVRDTIGVVTDTDSNSTNTTLIRVNNTAAGNMQKDILTAITQPQNNENKHLQLSYGGNDNKLVWYGGDSQSLLNISASSTVAMSGDVRSVCESNGIIHIAFNNNTAAIYCNSTTHGNFNCIQLDGTLSADNPSSPISLTCKDSHIFAVWRSGRNISYMNSSDSGTTWSDYVDDLSPLLTPIGNSSSDLVINNIVSNFGVNYNIWVTFIYDSGTNENVTIINTTEYGGNLPTITRYNISADYDTTSTTPVTIVNQTNETNEAVFVYMNNAGGSVRIVNYTLNSGMTWLSTSFQSSSAFTTISSPLEFNKTFYIAVSRTNPFRIQIVNSTDGITWTTSTSIYSGSEQVSTPTLVADNYSIYVFFHYGNVSTNYSSGNLSYFVWNRDNVWSSMKTTNTPPSNISSFPSAEHNSTDGLIDLIFINRTSGIGNADVRYYLLNTTNTTKTVECTALNILLNSNSIGILPNSTENTSFTFTNISSAMIGSNSNANISLLIDSNGGLCVVYNSTLGYGYYSLDETYNIMSNSTSTFGNLSIWLPIIAIVIAAGVIITLFFNIFRKENM
jgi:hypothetical protein